MNDGNFDKIFGDKLNAGKDFAFSEAKWNKMEGQLVVFEAEQRWRRLLKWLSLPLIALLGFSAWSAWTLHSAQNDLVRLTEEVKTLRLEKQVERAPSVFSPNLSSKINQIITKSDTVYHHVVVKRYDTVFQILVKREVSDAALPQQMLSIENQKDKTETVVSKNIVKPITIVENVAKPITAVENIAKPITTAENVVKPTTPVENLPKKVETTTSQTTAIVEKDNAISKNDEPKPTETTTPQTTLRNESNNPISDNKDEKTIETAVFIEKTATKDSLKTNKSNIFQTLAELKSKAITLLNIKKQKQLDEKEGKETAENQLTKPLPIIKPLKKIGFEMGLTGGLAMIGGQNIVRQEGFTAGLRAGVLLGQRWKIVGETQFLGLSYDIDKISGKQDIPIVAPPTVNDVFNKVSSEQSYIHYSLGLQYVSLQKRLKPYIGVGLLGQTKLEERFEHHFKNQITREDVSVKTQRKRDDFQAPFLRLQLGAEYPIFRKLKGQLEASYDVNMGHRAQFQPLYQVKGGVLYRF